MEYFKKVRDASRKAAIQGIQLIQTVTSAVSDVALAPARKPQEEFLFRFRVSCQLIDHYASVDDSDSVEADKALHASKVRDHLREMVRLLHDEDEVWAKRSVDVTDHEDDEEDHPCLEAFLQYHVMQELCNRALKDKPRGCMTVVLGTATSILRHVRYPLLPHQTVHVPLGQLISVATRYESLCTGKPGTTSYKKRIDLSLTTLISVIWRKISENPALLDFFYFVDNRLTTTTTTTTTVTDSKSAPKIRSQLDVLTALIPLMGRQKVGPYAKEAMLLALSLRDSRVERFVVCETGLLLNVVTELSRKFSVAVESQGSGSGASHGSSSLRQQPMGLDTSSRGTADIGSPAVTTDSTGSGPGSSTPTAVPASAPHDSFLKVLKFCNAICVAVSGSGSGNDGVDASISSSSRGMGTELLPQGVGIYQQLLLHFEKAFLLTCLRPALVVNGEGHVLATQALLRRTIAELARGSVASCPLLRSLTKFLCSDKDLLTVFVARAGSVSRPVAVSTMQLLGALLGASPLEQAMSLLLGEAKDGQVTATTPSVVKMDVGGSALDFSSEGDSPSPTTPTPISEPNPNVDTNDSMRQIAAFDARLTGICLELNSSQWDVASDNSNNNINNTTTDADGREIVQIAVDFKQYTDAATHSILNRLSGRLSALMALIREHDDKDEMMDDTDRSLSLSDGRGRGLLMGLVLRKLGVFLSLRLEEQLAVTGLIERCVCLLSAALTASSGSSKSDLDRLETVISVFKTVELLWKEVVTHLERVPDSALKMSAAKSLLVSSASEGGGGGTTHHGVEASPVDQKKRKLLDKEGLQVRRMLETAVIVRELLAEIRGSLHAVQLLRRGLVDVVDGPFAGGQVTGRDPVEEEE
eukprot:gene12005-25155_t